MFPPISGLFSKLLRFFERVNARRLAPQAGPEPACGATPFVYSARDLPFELNPASCSAAERAIAAWSFFADWPIACVPPPPD